MLIFKNSTNIDNKIFISALKDLRKYCFVEMVTLTRGQHRVKLYTCIHEDYFFINGNPHKRAARIKLYT